jgi:SAM-dependent methyltransferase
MKEPPYRDGYPEDGWLRGYFVVGDESGHVRQGPVRAWKNRDFLRLRDVALHLLDPRPGITILDVGCADGATMVYCGLQGAAVYGIDLNAEHVAAANAYLARFGIRGEARVADAAAMNLPVSAFDGVITSDFLEHVTDEVKTRVLRGIYDVLKPGRPLVIKTPNLAYLRLALLYKRARGVLHFRNPWRIVIPHTPGTDDPQHVGLTTRWALARCLEAAGFVNYRFVYAPLRRFGFVPAIDALSTEMPLVRDWLSEDLVCLAYKPITLAHFPD